ncbi:MAG: hypothetical protein HY736_13450 [Verrucomicrobia bacterium]|nr:hypothetical protein [Verrucomicrobiota bacterium]
MSTAEILAELPRLSPAEQNQIRQKLDELATYGADGWLDDGELTDADKRLLDERLAASAKNPEAGSTWEQVEARIHAKLRR